MEQNLYRLAQLIGPCPECGNGRLDAVFDGEATNFLCPNCGNCYHAELDWVHRVNPRTCSGCSSRDVCTTARRPYGEAGGQTYERPAVPIWG